MDTVLIGSNIKHLTEGINNMDKKSLMFIIRRIGILAELNYKYDVLQNEVHAAIVQLAALRLLDHDVIGQPLLISDKVQKLTLKLQLLSVKIADAWDLEQSNIEKFCVAKLAKFEDLTKYLENPSSPYAELFGFDGFKSH